MAYFDDLVPDYTMEVPAASAPSLEALRRLLYMFKLAMNGHIVAFSNEAGDVISLSPEFLTNFQWTLEEFQELEAGEFFHEDSSETAGIHKDNHLASPYLARCYKKNGTLSYYVIQGLCVEFDDQHWRMLSFEKIT
jgi:hypothetical protein